MENGGRRPQNERPAPDQAILGAKERIIYASLIETALRIATPEQFLDWAENELQQLFPHEILICGLGQIQPHSIRIHQYLSNHFPLTYLEEIRHRDGGILSPVMAAWCRELKPQLFQPGASERQVGLGWLAIFEKHQLRNIAAHGMKDLASGTGSYFSFSRIPGNLTPRHARLLELLVPHMHIALVRALAPGHAVQFIPAPPPEAAATTTPPPEITARELEILQWVHAGKTNPEIAKILGIREKTVKNHVQHILAKLRVNTRTHAAAKAVALKIISP